MCKPDSEQDPYDDRPFVDELLDKHAKAIAAVRESILADEDCKALYEKADNTKRYDDIWILRYVLSHKGHTKAAAKAAMNTIKFREEIKLNEAGDLKCRIKQHGVPDSDKIAAFEPLPQFQLFEKFCSENTVCLNLPDENRGLIMYCDVGALDQHAIQENMSEEQCKEMMLYGNEAMFQVVDEITRRTGRLTKVTKVIDMGNTSLRGMNRAYLKRDAACSKSLEDYYPQLLAGMLIFNGPTWVSMLWTAMKPFFPKRVAEKIDFLPSVSKLKGNKKALKPFLKYVSEEHLPERYGGLNKEWPLPCVAEHYVPN